MLKVTIRDDVAQTQPTPINVTPGKITSIHFQNEEIISYVILSDSSQHVYSLNAPTESGAARSIFLRRIKPLDFPGETTSSSPNLFIVTLDPQGIQQQYEFVIGCEKTTAQNITISSHSAVAVETELGVATHHDIRAGLKLQLRQGRLSESDQIVLAVAETLAISLNKDRNLIEVAEEMDIPLSLLSELGRIGLADRTRKQITGQSISESQSQSLRNSQGKLINDY